MKWIQSICHGFHLKCVRSGLLCVKMILCKGMARKSEDFAHIYSFIKMKVQYMYYLWCSQLSSQNLIISNNNNKNNNIHDDNNVTVMCMCDRYDNFRLW